MGSNMLPPLIGVLRGDISHFAAKMGEAKAVAAEASGFNATAFGGMAAIGKTALLGIAGAAVGVGVVSLKMAGDFQDSMTKLVTGAGESKSNMDLVSKGILDMAGQVGMSAQDLASGMYMIESAGYHGAAGLEVLKTSAMGAKVGGADMATVANALTSALNAYHLPASQATSVTNDLIATVASGKMHMEDLASALGTVLPAASTAGVSLKEVSAAIATMTMQGTPAADAATYLRQTILQLENPSAKAQKALKDVGLSSHQLAEDLGKKGLAATLQEATDAISKKFAPGSSEYVAHLADMVGGTKSMQAALELSGKNMAVFKANAAGIGSAVAEGGNKVKGWDEVQGDFNFKMEAAKDKFGALAITLGTMLIPYVEKGMDMAARFADYLSKNKVAAEIFAVAIGGPILVAIAAYTVSMISAAVATVAATWPILLIIAAVAALAVGAVLLYNHWGQVVAFFQGAFHTAITAVGGWFSALGATIHSIVTATGTVLVNGFFAPINAVVGFFKWLFDHNTYFHDLVVAIRGAWDKAMADVQEVWGAITGFLGGLWDRLTAAAGAAFGGLANIIGDKLAGGWNTISGFVDKVDGFLGGLADKALHWGENMIGQFIQGIKNSAGGVLSAVSGIAGNIASVLGFHSPPPDGPAADSDTWMPNFIGMLVGGLHAGHGQVASAAAGLAGGMQASLSSPLAVSVASSGGGVGGSSVSAAAAAASDHSEAILGVLHDILAVLEQPPAQVPGFESKLHALTSAAARVRARGMVSPA